MFRRTLDVATLPHEQIYVCDDGWVIDMSKYLDKCRAFVDSLDSTGITQANDSFGFALATPRRPNDSLPDDRWDDPSDFVWFCGGWGPDRDQRIADAVRKLRPLLRNRKLHELYDSTLDFQLYRPRLFKNKVRSISRNGIFRWGDIPLGGALRLKAWGLTLFGGCSYCDPFEDDSLAYVILWHLAKEIRIHRSELPLRGLLDL